MAACQAVVQILFVLFCFAFFFNTVIWQAQELHLFLLFTFSFYPEEFLHILREGNSYGWGQQYRNHPTALCLFGWRPNGEGSTLISFISPFSPVWGPLGCMPGNRVGSQRPAKATVLSEWILISCSSCGYFGDVPFLQCSRTLLVLDSSHVCLFLSDMAAADWKGNTVKGVALTPNSRGITLETFNFSPFLIWEENLEVLYFFKG